LIGNGTTATATDSRLRDKKPLPIGGNGKAVVNNVVRTTQVGERKQSSRSPGFERGPCRSNVGSDHVVAEVEIQLTSIAAPARASALVWSNRIPTALHGGRYRQVLADAALDNPDAKSFDREEVAGN